MSAGPLYEAHITVNIRDGEKAGLIGEARGWKTSAIHGDPVLGNRPFFYLTQHSNELLTIMQDVSSVVVGLQLAGIEVLRQKLELIIIDTKTGRK